jgi:hypothetical protein
MGHAHAIYNPTDKPVQWMNINVGMSSNYDAFDLGDSRAAQSKSLDPIPQFPTLRMDRALLRPMATDGNKGTAQYRAGWNQRYSPHRGRMSIICCCRRA